jgi:hypothetical protein
MRRTMKKRKKKRVLTPRLPMAEVLFLRSHGGAQSTKSGKRGYDRKREKQAVRRADNDVGAPF